MGGWLVAGEQTNTPTPIPKRPRVAVRRPRRWRIPELRHANPQRNTSPLPPLPSSLPPLPPSLARWPTRRKGAVVNGVAGG